jgi:hypothetical protein
LVQSYFGFDTLATIRKRLEETKAVVIEDITHSLFSDIPRVRADYYTGSLRKWGPLPDGGFAISSKGSFGKKPILENDSLLRLKLDALHKKFRYIKKGEGLKQDYLDAFRLAETEIENENQIYKMSGISAALFKSWEIGKIADLRQKNYRVLFDMLSNCRSVSPVLGNLEEGVVPLYFPIYHSKRSELQAYLAEHKVYAPVIWPIPSFLEEMDWLSKVVYRNILAIPCDQRYTQREMVKVGELITAFDNRS